MKSVKRQQAIVLLSGGLDSAVALYVAKSRGLKCHCLIFDYGQRHKRELKSAKAIARKARCPWRILKISLPWKGSALLDKEAKIGASLKVQGYDGKKKIPATYVPGRNIIFLSFALSFAESLGAVAIYIGAHSHDYSGYPDCRLEFFRAFRRLASLGTKTGIEKKKISIFAPLLHKNKSQIIRMGNKLGVPIELTWSCYEGKARPCRKCDSCYYREKGFREAGLHDPLIKKRNLVE